MLCYRRIDALLKNVVELKCGLLQSDHESLVGVGGVTAAVIVEDLPNLYLLYGFSFSFSVCSDL